jgi:hypothetical protein
LGRGPSGSDLRREPGGREPLDAFAFLWYEKIAAPSHRLDDEQTKP